MKADDSRLEPDFSHMHLQWFGDDDEGGGEGESDEGGAEDGEKDVETEVAELKKAFAQLKKESAGKDRKVGELLEENKKLKTKKSKQAERERDIDFADLSAEQIKREIERREGELKAEHERELSELMEKQKYNERTQTIYRIAPDIDNLHPHIIKLLIAAEESDEDTLRDLMSASQKEVETLINKNKFVLGNVEKAAHRPQTGDAAGRVPTNREWENMSEIQRRAWAKSATPEQRAKIEFRK